MGSFKNNLPNAWAHTSLGEAYEVIGGGTPSTEKPEFWGGDIPWITSADIEGVRQIAVRKYVTEKGIAGSTTSKVPSRTLLVVTRVGLGKIAISDAPICFSQDLQGLVQKPELICPEYTLYLLSYELQILKFEGRGTTISGVTKKQLKDLGFPLPPINEQLRIVTKIEELFSELDKGIESFKTAREQLKVYRQALLKHAFEGKLTAAWREENKGVDLVGAKQGSSASPAFYHRGNQGESQSLGEAGETFASPLQERGQLKRRKELSPLTAVELAELPELPYGWGWVKLKSISDVSGGLTKNQKRMTLPNKLPFLRVANVYFNRLELDEMHEIGLNDSEIERVLLKKGDLLIVEGNGSVDQIGRVAIWNGAVANCVHQNHIIKARPDSFTNTKFLLYFLMSELGRKFIVQVASSTSGLHTLSISKVESLFIPRCSIEEQNQILIELDEKLSEIDNLDQTITTALQQAETLRQSILKKAFSGQLVAQDPDDEPAAKLLERIKAERTTVGAKQGSSASPGFYLKPKGQNKRQNQGEAGKTLASSLQNHNKTKRKSRKKAIK